MERQKTPNGLEMSRPASQAQYRINGADPAGRVGSIELLGAKLFDLECIIWKIDNQGAKFDLKPVVECVKVPVGWPSRRVEVPASQLMLENGPVVLSEGREGVGGVFNLLDEIEGRIVEGLVRVKARSF